MTPLVLLMALLALSYLGSYFVEGRALEGIGLPSGVEWVIVGIVVGPSVLHVIRYASLVSLAPLLHVAVGWLGLIVGLEYGRAGGGRLRVRTLVLGLISSGVPFALAFAGAYAVATRYGHHPAHESYRIAAAVGALSSETTRHAVRWARSRYGAKGSLTDLLDELADTEDLLPLLALAVLSFDLVRRSGGAQVMGALGALVAGAAVLGAIGAALLGRTFHVREAWGMVLGIALVGSGLAVRLGFATMPFSFVMGLVLSLASPLSDRLRALLGPTERPVLLPALVMLGASVHFALEPWAYVLVAAAVLARLVGKLLVGAGLSLFHPEARAGGPWVGAALGSSGVVTASIALSIALAAPGPLGDAAVLMAFAQLVVGELFGPVAVRAALARAGELDASPAAVEEVRS